MVTNCCLQIRENKTEFITRYIIFLISRPQILLSCCSLRKMLTSHFLFSIVLGFSCKTTAQLRCVMGAACRRDPHFCYLPCYTGLVRKANSCWCCCCSSPCLFEGGLSVCRATCTVQGRAPCKLLQHQTWENLSTTPLGWAVPIPDCDQNKSRQLCHDRALPYYKIVPRVPHASQKPRRGCGPCCGRAQAGAVYQAGAGLGQVQPLLAHGGCPLLYLCGINFISLATPI